MYPQCYFLIWIRKSDENVKSVLFSEVLFVDEYGDQRTIVCCEKCKRPIDVRAFKQTTHAFIHVLGESFIRLEHAEASPVSHRHTSMSTHLQYSANNVCDLAIQGETNQDAVQNVYEQTKQLAFCLLNDSRESCDALFDTILTTIRKHPHNVSVEKRIIYQTPALILSLIYELSALSPSLRDNLMITGNTLIHTFMGMSRFAEHSFMLQNLVAIFSSLLQKAPSDSYSQTIQKALLYIHNNYSTPITLEETAKFVGVQSDHLSKHFKKALDQSFSNYLKHYRINRAILLMKNEKYSLTEIALNVGFDSSTYFSTSFKQIFNVTPSAYRNKFFI